MSKNHKKIVVNLFLFISEMWELLKSPTFLILTILGNFLIGLFSWFFYLFESPYNFKIHNFLDALWCGMSTATTTGYGDITPVTKIGKILGILLMLSGMALFAMFTALFAETILANSKNNNSIR